MAIKAGWEYKLYRNTNTYASPTWNEVDNVKDLQMPHGGSADDVTIRRHGAYKASMLAQKEIGATFEMLIDYDDADFTAFRTAHYNRSTIDVIICDGDITVSGTKGMRFVAAVTKFDEDQSLAQFGRVSVELTQGWITDATQAASQWVTA